MTDLLSAIICAVITGGLTLLGVIISNNKTMAVQGERMDQMEKKQKKLEDKQEKLESEVHAHGVTLSAHATSINGLTKKVDTMEQNMLHIMK